MFDIILEQVTENYKDLQEEERAQRIVAEITEEIRKAKNELTLNFQSILSNQLDLRTMEKLFGEFLGVIKNLEDYHVSRTNELLIETEVSVNSILGQLEVIFESVNVHSKLAAHCFPLYAICSIIRAAILNERSNNIKNSEQTRSAILKQKQQVLGHIVPLYDMLFSKLLKLTTDRFSQISETTEEKHRLFGLWKVNEDYVFSYSIDGKQPPIEVKRIHANVRYEERETGSVGWGKTSQRRYIETHYEWPTSYDRKQIIKEAETARRNHISEVFNKEYSSFSRLKPTILKLIEFM